jgi:hypothetical protein
MPQQEVMINFDDELSQVVESRFNPYEVPLKVFESPQVQPEKIEEHRPI